MLPTNSLYASGAHPAGGASCTCASPEIDSGLPFGPTGTMRGRARDEAPMLGFRAPGFREARAGLGFWRAVREESHASGAAALRRARVLASEGGVGPGGVGARSDVRWVQLGGVVMRSCVGVGA